MKQKPWEDEDTEDLNQIPEEFLDAHGKPVYEFEESAPLKLGDYQGLLKFHLAKISPNVPSGLCKLEQEAIQFGLWPLVVRLHLEHRGLIRSDVHQKYLETLPEKQAPKRPMDAQRMLLKEHTIQLADGTWTVKYFDECELNFGKQVDLLKSRINRLYERMPDEVESALIIGGLSWADINTWSVSDLCIALYQLDSIDKSLWNMAVSAHFFNVGWPAQSDEDPAASTDDESVAPVGDEDDVAWKDFWSKWMWDQSAMEVVDVVKNRHVCSKSYT